MQKNGKSQRQQFPVSFPASSAARQSRTREPLFPGSSRSRRSKYRKHVTTVVGVGTTGSEGHPNGTPNTANHSTPVKWITDLSSLVVTKNAHPSVTRTYTWGVSKAVDKNKTVVQQSGTRVFNYTVNVTHDAAPAPTGRPPGNQPMVPTSRHA